MVNSIQKKRIFFEKINFQVAWGHRVLSSKVDCSSIVTSVIEKFSAATIPDLTGDVPGCLCDAKLGGNHEANGTSLTAFGNV